MQGGIEEEVPKSTVEKISAAGVTKTARPRIGMYPKIVRSESLLEEAESGNAKHSPTRPTNCPGRV